MLINYRAVKKPGGAAGGVGGCAVGDAAGGAVGAKKDEPCGKIKGKVDSRFDGEDPAEKVLIFTHCTRYTVEIVTFNNLKT